jgi:hypothetical protein
MINEEVNFRKKTKANEALKKQLYLAAREAFLAQFNGDGTEIDVNEI